MTTNFTNDAHFPPLTPQPVMASQILEACQTIDAMMVLVHVRIREIITNSDIESRNEFSTLRYIAEAGKAVSEFMREQVKDEDGG